MDQPPPTPPTFTVELWIRMDSPQTDELATQLRAVLDRLAATARAAEILRGMPSVAQEAFPDSDGAPALRLRWVGVAAGDPLDALGHMSSVARELTKPFAVPTAVTARAHPDS